MITIILSTLKGLIVPYIIVSLILLIATKIIDETTGTDDFVSRLIGQLTINGLMDNPQKYGNFLYGGGSIWFLLALAWLRIIYSILQRIIPNNICLLLSATILSYSSYYFGKHFFMPFYLLQGFSCLLFFHFGTILKKHEQIILNNKIVFMVLGIIVCLFGLMFGFNINVWGLWFTCWPINYMIAIFASIMIYSLCSIVSQSNGNNKIVTYIAHLGRFSILILSLNALETEFHISENFLMSFHVISSHNYIFRTLLICFLFTFCIFGLYLIERIKIVRILFCIK